MAATYFTLSELALSVAYPYGMVLDDGDQEQQAMNAARFYLGHGRIASLDAPIAYANPTDALFTPYRVPYLGPSDGTGVISSGINFGPDTRAGDGAIVQAPSGAPAPSPADPLTGTEIKPGTRISPSEWAIIKPLYMLYVERENARVLETSRQQGVEVYGRDVASIQADIERQENEVLPRAAFFQPVETI
jgi:hypothetical protein